MVGGRWQVAGGQHSSLCTVIWVLMVLMVLTLVGCQRSPEVIKVGLMAPFEGESRKIGYDGIYAARLAVREFNAEHNDLKLALVALDDSGRLDIAQANSEALAADPALVAVVGMGADEISLISAENFAQAGIPYLHIGVSPFDTVDPALYPAEFRSDYEAVTPFDEVAEEYAGSVYDAFRLLEHAIIQLKRNGDDVSAESVAEILKSVKIQGITGKEIFWEGK